MFLKIKVDGKEVYINTDHIASLIPQDKRIVMQGRIKPFTVDKRTFDKILKVVTDNGKQI